MAINAPPKASLAEIVNQVFLEHIEARFAEYEQQINGSRLSAQTKATYLEHPRRFVRWLKGEPIAALTEGS